MACYVRIGGSVDTEEQVEVPTEDDGTLLLSSVSAQFPDTVGLRYKSESGCWRGVRLQGNILKQPMEGWGDSDYYVIKKKPLKREAEDDDVGPNRKSNKIGDDGVLPDLMVANLPFSATDDEVRSHFEKFGELDMCDIKYDKDDKSRGFGFIRFKTMRAVEEALGATHFLDNRKCELRYSNNSLRKMDEKIVPTKLFVGRVPRGTTTTELEEHFSPYGVLKDVYIPTPPRGYGFVTFGSQVSAKKALNETQVLKGQFLNLSLPNEKRVDGMFGQFNAGHGIMQGGSFSNMQGNMQSNQMGNMQGNMSGGMNAWMHGNMQNQNGGSNKKGNYSSLGLRKKLVS